MGSSKCSSFKVERVFRKLINGVEPCERTHVSLFLGPSFLEIVYYLECQNLSELFLGFLSTCDL